VTRILLIGLPELDVLETFNDILSRIANAETNGPQVGGRRVLPAGWMTVRSSELGKDVFLQTSTISYVVKD
jgi:hypothetical protein